VVAYELLAGYLPFDSDDIAMLRQAVMQDPLDAIRNVPEQVNAVLKKALEKDATKRFENCREFVRNLETVPEDSETKVTEKKAPILEPPRLPTDFPVQHGFRLYIDHVAFSPDGKRIVTVSNVTSKMVQLSPNTSPRHASHAIVQILDTGDGTVLQKPIFESMRIAKGAGYCFEYCGFHVASVAFSPDGKRIIMTCSDKNVRIWTLE
jgi:WD40 repeat protein